MKKTSFLLVAFLMAFSLSSSQAQAGEYADAFKNNMSRGFKNILTGWMEVPISIAEHHKDTEQAPVLREARGLFDGMFRALGRTMSGMFDLGVAWIPGNQEGEPVKPETLDL